jgi:hypothetical protein
MFLGSIWQQWRFGAGNVIQLFFPQQLLGFSLFCTCNWCYIDALFCFFIENSGNKLLELRINIMLIVRLHKNVIDIYRMLEVVYGKGTMDRTQVSVCVKRYYM